MKPQIINIINFIRGVEPRDPGLDLLEPVTRQVELLEKYSLPGTFLIQYDAMINPSFVNLLKRSSSVANEIGAWFEVVQPLVENAGLEWRGRPGFSWDWHADVGFTVGYTPEEREKLSDVFMEDFRNIFGFYPKSVGSWIIDAHTLAYLEKKYGITASCNCRDQWGTDGYTLWGGYYNQAYYPGRHNVFCPAQTVKNQINVPIFRMLGSDPIYQYDAGLVADGSFTASEWQPVVTLEPVYPVGGGSEEWIRWFLKENFNGICLAFGYAQAGQENSFGWPAMEKGLLFQFEQISEFAAQGKIKVETLADSADWFRKKYPTTPASVVAALSDWKDDGHRSIWYNSRYYRINLYQEAEKLWIRDLHIFNENYEERYLANKCAMDRLYFDNLPVIDGNRWSHGKTRAGLYPVIIGEDDSTALMEVYEPEVSEMGDDELKAVWKTEMGFEFEVLCKEDSVAFSSRGNVSVKWCLKMLWNPDVEVPVGDIADNSVKYCFNGFKYTVCFSGAEINERMDEGSITIVPCKNEIFLNWEHAEEL